MDEWTRLISLQACELGEHLDRSGGQDIDDWLEAQREIMRQRDASDAGVTRMTVAGPLLEPVAERRHSVDAAGGDHVPAL